MAIGKELLFTLDDFSNPKMLESVDTFGQMLLNLFMMRPGNLQSMPHIGIDIPRYLNTLGDSLDAEALKKQIYDQCSQLFSTVALGDVRIYSTPINGVGTLLISVPVNGTDTTVLIGFSSTNPSDPGALRYGIEFQEQAKAN